jgi:uncharacterized protein YoxC
VSDGIDDRGFDERVRAVLGHDFKDQRLLEVDTAEKIADRVMRWAKLFGFFIGIPVAIIGIALGALGIKSISDLKAMQARVDDLKEQAHRAEDDVATMRKSVYDARAAARAANSDLTQLQNELATRREQLAKLQELDQLQQEFRTLSERVSSLEEIGIGGSGTVTGEVKQQIENTLARFQAYFSRLGFKFDSRERQRADVKIEAASKMMGGTIAYFTPNPPTMFVDEKFANDMHVVLREYSHRILWAANPDLQKSQVVAASALQSGLADYFPACLIGSPSFTSMKRTLVNSTPITNPRDYGEMQEVGLAWGGAMWDLRTKIGAPADRVVFEAWRTFRARAGFQPAEFANHLIATDQRLNGGANAAVLRELFAKRGVTF